MTDPYDWWRASLAGSNPPIHDGEPQCGYFKVRDRRGIYANVAPIKRPFIAAAIWFEDGQYRAEIAGNEVEIERAWPWIAKHPITFAEYKYWHENERWPSAKEEA